MVRDVMKARCTRCYINVDVTAGEALIITLVVNRELAREASERNMIGSRRRKEKESGMRRAEFRERARNYQARGKDVEVQKLPCSRAADLAAVASALFLAAVTVRIIRCRDFDKSECAIVSL